MYRIKIGNGYFAGYSETLAMMVLEGIPGSLRDAKVFDSRDVARFIADQIVGEIEIVN